MKVCIVSIFTNEPYRKLIRGWIENMRELFLPDAEREWYIVTDSPDHKDFKNTGLSLHLEVIPPGMSKQDIWRNKWKWVEEGCGYAEKTGCPYIILAQSNVRCCTLIDEALFHRRMEKATNGNPVSVRHMVNLVGTEAQACLCFGAVAGMKEFAHFWRGRCEDDEWWKGACAAGMYDEWQLSSKYMKEDLKELVGFADSGFSHDLRQWDNSWRPVGGDIEDRVMCTICKQGYAQSWMTGGLGNVLFELAYAYTYAKKNRLIPTCSYRSSEALRRHLPEFSKYFNDADPFPKGTVSCLSFPTYVEDCAAHLGGYNVHLKGYTQGIGGFKEQEEAIRKLFSSLAAGETLIGTVGVHIRGWDYITNKYSLLSKAEIRNALDHHRDKGKKLYIFTDDPKLANGLMEGIDRGFEEVEWRIGSRKSVKSCYNDFKLMSSMEVMICSASTYSWWACYLGRVKKVYWQYTRGSGCVGAYMGNLKLPEWEYLDKEEHGEKEDCKLLVIIQTCEKTKERRENCRNTWLKRVPEGVKYFFCRGDKDAPYAHIDRDETDMVVVRCEDNYYHLCDKTREMFCYAEERYNFSHILKCDDDSYIRLERAVEMLTDDIEALGTEHFSGGGGYFLRQDVVKAINRHLEYNFPGYRPEDIMIAETAEQLGYKRIRSTRMCMGSAYPPFPGNDQISCHYIDKERGEIIEHFFSSDCLDTCYALFPSSCIAVLSFDRAGTFGFYFSSMKDKGVWKREGEDIVLEGEEKSYRIHSTGNGYWEGDFKVLSPLLKLTSTGE